MLKKIFNNLFPPKLTLKDEYDYLESLVKSCRTKRGLYEIEAKVTGIIMRYRKSVTNEELRIFANSTDDLLLNRKDELESEELAKYSRLAKQHL